MVEAKFLGSSFVIRGDCYETMLPKIQDAINVKPSLFFKGLRLKF